MALPTWEHYAPVLVAAGAASGAPGATTFPITGFWMEGAFTKRSIVTVSESVCPNQLNRMRKHDCG